MPCAVYCQIKTDAHTFPYIYAHGQSGKRFSGSTPPLVGDHLYERPALVALGVLSQKRDYCIALPPNAHIGMGIENS